MVSLAPVERDTRLDWGEFGPVAASPTASGTIGSPWWRQSCSWR